MAISLYDVTVRSFVQVLTGAAGFLEKGLVHCRDKGVDPATVVETRLAPDMLPFRFQVYSIVHHSRGAIEGVRAGVFSPPVLPEGLDYAGLQSLIAEAKVALEAVSPEEINALQGRDMAFKGRARSLEFTAEDFLLSFSTPNLHFHATTAYDILRSHGVPLGKGDYMGPLRLKS